MHIGATEERFLKGAELIGLIKIYHNGELKEFLVDDCENFQNSDNFEELLTESDRLKIINYELNRLRLPMMTDEMKFADNVALYKYDGIINQLIKQNVISSVFPVHGTELKKLEQVWYKGVDVSMFLHFIPIDRIKDYFGESVAFYFSFFEFYTKFLIPLAMIGLLTWILPASSIVKFTILCVCNLIWSTLFIETWKRKSAHQSYLWGTHDLDNNENPRVDFEGIPRISPITNKLELYSSKKKRTMKKYFVSYPIVFISILVTIATMFIYYRIENKILALFTDDSYSHFCITFLPSIVYSIVVMIYGMVYSSIAVALTNWENHRTDTSYESNLTVKLFVFYFANNFVCLFYEAFYNRNFNNLSSMMVSLLTMNALINKLLEVFAPYLKKKIKKKIYTKKITQDCEILNEIGKQAYTLEPEEDTYNDYITMFEQFGYLTLFSAVFPWISLAALINNVMEERSDAFKYCHVSKRPFPKSINGIGPWLTAFEILGFISVATNFALIALHPEAREYFKEYSDMEYIMIFVLLEHLMIALKLSIMVMVPDVPGSVIEKKKKAKYEALECLRKDRLASITKKRL